MSNEKIRDNFDSDEGSLSALEATKNSNIKGAAFAIQLIRRFLTVLGLWRVEDVSGVSKRASIAYLAMAIYYFAITMRTIPMIVYVIFNAKGLVLTMKTIARAWWACVTGMKYCFLHYYSCQIADCMKRLQMDWMEIRSQANRDIMINYAQQGHVMTKIYGTVSMSMAVLVALLPFFVKKTPTIVYGENNTVLYTTKPRTFWVVSNFGFSRQKETPFFEMIWAIQIIATLMLHSIQVSVYNVAVVIVMHTCAQLQIVMNKLKKLTDPSDASKKNDSFGDKMGDIVKQHMRTLKFLSNGGKMLSFICLIDLGTSVVLLCFMGYFFVINSRVATRYVIAMISNVFVMITVTFNIYSICYIGELATQECEKVGEVAYMTEWHKLSGKQHLGLCLIIAMSQRPEVLSAGGTIPMTFDCFMNVLKSAAGYFNMLRAVME